MPVWLPLLIWDMNQFQWVWIIFFPENSGKTCSLWFPNVCKPQVGTQGWWVDCVSVKFLGAQSTLHVPAGIFKPSTATTNRWQCSAYLKEAKLHQLFHIFIWLSIPPHDPPKAQILLNTNTAILLLYVPTLPSLAIINRQSTVFVVLPFLNIFLMAKSIPLVS